MLEFCQEFYQVAHMSFNLAQYGVKYYLNTTFLIDLDNTLKFHVHDKIPDIFHLGVMKMIVLFCNTSYWSIV